jgi:KUP system potassium uptake protein
MPISIAVLAVLFAAQRYIADTPVRTWLMLVRSLGTQRIATFYAPVVVLWLFTLGATGIAGIIQHPGIFRAFDISRAIAWFARTKDYWSLSSVALAITGCEGAS